MIPFKAIVNYTSAIGLERISLKARFTSVDQAKKFARRMKKDGALNVIIHNLESNGKVGKEIKFR